MADRKITDLTALAAGSQATGDFLTIVDVSEAAAVDKNKKITVESLFKGIPSNVGIGTSSPTTNLEINGGTNNNIVRIVSTDANANIEFADNTTTSGCQIGANGDNLKFGISGSEAMRIDSSGNVGIGTSSPVQQAGIGLHINNSSGQARLKLTNSASGATANDGFDLIAQTNNEINFINHENAALKFSNNDIERLRIGSSGTVEVLTNQFTVGTHGTTGLQFISDGTFGTLQSADLKFRTASTERMRIDSSGRLLVGTTTEGAALADNLTVAESGHCGITIRSGAQHFGSIYFSDGVSGGAGEYSGFVEYNHNGDYLGFGTGGTTRARIDSSGRLLHNTTSTGTANIIIDSQLGNGSALRLIGKSANDGSEIDFYADNNSTRLGYLEFNNTVTKLVSETSVPLSLHTNGTERMRIDSSGNVGIGTTSPQQKIHLHENSTGACLTQYTNSITGATANDGFLVGLDSTEDGLLFVKEAKTLIFGTNNTERMRLTSGGTLLIGQTTDSFGNKGHILNADGRAFHIVEGNTPLWINRLSNDGNLIAFYQNSTQEGSVEVNGTTVSYNGAHLSRWSQLAGGVARTEILRGSVLSNLDEMCEWGEEDNEQLNRMKVSDVEGDKNVSGVFQSWDDDDDTYVNDFYCAMTGDFVIRIAQGTTVARGDLLMSAGDGTAKPQDDDIVRSKTIAKVTSTTVSTTYSDNSYCVPCVLMAC